MSEINYINIDSLSEYNKEHLDRVLNNINPEKFDEALLTVNTLLITVDSYFKDEKSMEYYSKYRDILYYLEERKVIVKIKEYNKK